MRRLAPVVLLLLLVPWVPAAGAWTWPVSGPVLQGFSFDRAHPYAGGQHRGIDVGANAAGLPVLAPASGVVGFAGTVPSSGRSVTIDTADGLAVTLTNLGSISVAKGDAVDEGAAVGTVGPSGTPEVAGPYVHLGIRTAADPQGYLDPLGFLPVAAAPASSPAPAPAAAPAAAAPPVPVSPAAPAPAAAVPAAEPSPPAAEASPAAAPSVSAPAGAPGAAAAPPARTEPSAVQPRVEPEPVGSGVAVVAPPAEPAAPRLVRAAPPAPGAEAPPVVRRSRPRTHGSTAIAEPRVAVAPLSARAAVPADISPRVSAPVTRRLPHRDAPAASAHGSRPHVPFPAELAAVLAAALAALAAVAAALRRRTPARAPVPTGVVLAFPPVRRRDPERLAA